MIAKSAFQMYNRFLLFLCVRVLASTTEDYNLYTDPNSSNDFENNTTGEYNPTTTTSDHRNFSMNAFDLVSVSPAEVVVDTEAELQLSITNRTGTNSTPVFCFLITPDDDLEVLTSYWISNTRINCTGFRPLVPGLFSIGPDHPKVRKNSDKKLTVKVISKRPVAEGAEYGYNFDKIFIHFDANIELQSNCAGAFSKTAVGYFGSGFGCSVNGNDLAIKMGVDFKVTTAVEIRAGNKICRSGSRKEFCLPAKPGRVEVTRPKAAGPAVSLATTSECGPGNASEKYVSFKVSSNDEKENADGVTPTDHSGKNQRRNLIVWRALRRIQNMLPSNLTVKMDKSDMKTLYENLASVENFLENETLQLGSSPSGVTVSVHVQSPPAGGIILAEANVTFCKHFNRPFRYKWIVNEKIVPDDDKVMLLEDISPGKYLIKCNIVEYNSSEVLGEGWTTTEMFDSRPRVIVYPVALVAPATEDISLHAVVWHGGKISWACKTKTGKVCITNSRASISDVIDTNTSDISIPAGALPAGEYIWTVENAQGVNAARIIIDFENAVTVNVKMGSVFVGRSQKVVLEGVAKGLQNECRLWWNGVREKGFDYLNLRKFESDAEVLVRDGETEKKIELVFPPALENREDLKPSSLYMLKLQAFCPYSYAYVKIPVSVNDPPKVSSVEVEPKKGLAMATNFIISKVEADDSVEDHPLLFEWSYLDTCGAEIPITRGASSRQVTTFLPPGDIKVVVKVCDVKGACTSVSSSVIDVGHSKTVPENFRNAANQIKYLMVGPNYLEAFGLAATVLKSLALKAETEIRREVFRSVEEGIYARIKRFNESAEATAKGVRLRVDFVERALNVARHLPKRSAVNEHLADFKKDVLRNAAKKGKT